MKELDEANEAWDKDVAEAKGWIEGFKTLGAGNINILFEGFHPYVVAEALHQIAEEWQEFGDEIEDEEE